MGLKPEASVTLALATGVLVWSIYQHVMPSVIDHRAGDQDDEHARKAERAATWTAAGAVSAISLITKDPTTFIVGGGMVVAASFLHRHANMVNPLTGRASSGAPFGDMPAEEAVSPDLAYVG